MTLCQKDTKANHSPFLMGWAFASPLFFIGRNSFVEIKGWSLRTNFSNEKFGFKRK